MKMTITAIVLVGFAFYIGQTKEADHYTDLQEENRVIQSYERGYEAGQRELIQEATTALCGGYKIKCGYAPSVAAPLPKPEREV